MSVVDIIFLCMFMIVALYVAFWLGYRQASYERHQRIQRDKDLAEFTHEWNTGGQD